MPAREDVAQHPEDSRYLFWSRFTAAQARRSGRSREEIARRVVAAFRDVCETVRPSLTVELGAHEGVFSTWARRTFPDARCVALEANPYVHAKHRKRLERAGVEYHHLAAADTTGTVTLNIPQEVHGRPRERTNRMASLGVHVASGGVEAVQVPAVRLDEFVDLSSDDRVVAWIDVEGASSQVLPGASQVLARAAAVFIEVEKTTTWEGQWLDVDVGRFFAGLGKVPALRDTERPHQYNVVFLEPALAAQVEVARRLARALAPAGVD